MTRMIERWFPCAEVSANSRTGWGSGNGEKGLFPWFAARPTAQAKAAVLCSLLPWPDDEAEQKRLQALVQEAMTGRYAAWADLRAEILKANRDNASVFDPFAGRGMIPLEAARLGLPAFGIDYSPVAVLAARLLTNYPARDWSGEPEVQLVESGETLYDDRPRLLRDVDAVLSEVGRRFTASMAPYYPTVEGKLPWGYLWAITLPCQECGSRFPLVGSYELRKPSTSKGSRTVTPSVDPGESFYIDADTAAGEFRIVVHPGGPRRTPTLVKASTVAERGKAAICPFCSHVHPLSVHRRLTNEGKGEDRLLVVADHGERSGKVYREPTRVEIEAAHAASKALSAAPAFGPFLSAVPDEGIAPGNNNIIAPSIYGARTYGDFMCDRQALSFVVLTQHINNLAIELVGERGISADYAQALAGYAAAVVARKVRYSTRSASLQLMAGGTVKIHDIYANQGSIGFSQDYFEAGIGTGPGSWASLASSTRTTLAGLLKGIKGGAVEVERGSATNVTYSEASMQAVVTDPPYDRMIAYADSSDLIYVWVKRALHGTWPELALTADPYGCQEKFEEIIVKRQEGTGKLEVKDHRTREHYDAKIAEAFREMRRVVRQDGVVTIVFGSGDPEVWQRLLSAVRQAGLVMTGSWPANTEAGSQHGTANIETTLTMVCRPAPADRRAGRKGAVESEIKAEVKRRYPDWERWGLAPADMLMAAAGPAMEVVGRYSEVLDARGEPVDIYTFLPLARAAVQEAMAVEVDHHPLETFDARTRFALWWVRLYGRQVQAKSELRWQTLASSMDLGEVRDLVPDADKGVRFVAAQRFKGRIDPESAVIDVALALAAASEDGLAAMGDVLAASGRGVNDAYLWAAVKFLADRLPDSDPDAIAFTRVLRVRDGIGSAAESVIATEEQRQHRQTAEDSQLKLL